jgi:hypothetical protein
MFKWLHRLFGGSGDSTASEPAEPATPPAPPPTPTEPPADAGVPAEGTPEPSGDEPA